MCPGGVPKILADTTRTAGTHVINGIHTAAGFRGDINGLRAWAVVAVVLYHFAVPGFGGGFVGVDVFFVISGFLMTRIVVRGLERGDFSLRAFYMARARRILPALIVLCAVLMALGWWWLLPLDYKQLGSHTVSSLAFLSNIVFRREAGYFDIASHEKWLLHTWSLAVEWQFYLLLPMVLLAVWKWRPGRPAVIALLVALLLISFMLSLAVTPRKPSAAFFLLPARAWEMLAGGMVYLLAARWALTERQRVVLETASLVLVIGSIVGFEAASAWPGWRALLPVMGAAGILMAARPDSSWTAHPVAQWLGTRSYSLYLWHWPIVVALTYLGWQADPQAIAIGLLLTLVLGDLSYRLVESPARIHLERMRLGGSAAVLLCGAVAVAITGERVRLQEGVPGRFPPEIERVSQEALNTNPRISECHAWTGSGSPSCMFGGSRLSAIVLGDSHANALVSAVAAARSHPDDGVREWTFSGCPTLIGVKSLKDAKWACGAFLNWTLQELKHVPRDVPVVVVNRHGLYTVGENEDLSQANRPKVFFSERYETSTEEFLEEYGRHLVDTACRLAQERPVYLVRPIPELGIHVPQTARAMVWGQHNEVSVAVADYHQRNAFIWAAQDAARDRCGVKILDPLPYLCSEGRCHGSKGGRPLYSDDDHLSEFGNKVLIPMFAPVFQAR